MPGPREWRRIARTTRICRSRGSDRRDLWVRFDEIKSCNSASSDPSGCFLSTQKVESTNDRLWWVDWCRNDPSSAVVPDVSVEIADNAKGTAQSTKTDREGVYQFFFLAPARYTLTVTRDGFRKERRAVTVLVGPPVTVNVALELAKESTTVNVTGEAPLIQAENGDVSTTMNQEQISGVPNPGNDLTYIAQTGPGMVMNTDQGNGNFSSLGMPATSNLFTVDGMNDNQKDVSVNLAGA